MLAINIFFGKYLFAPLFWLLQNIEYLQCWQGEELHIWKLFQNYMVRLIERIARVFEISNLVQKQWFWPRKFNNSILPTLQFCPRDYKYCGWKQPGLSALIWGHFSIRNFVALHRTVYVFVTLDLDRTKTWTSLQDTVPGTTPHHECYVRS